MKEFWAKIRNDYLAVTILKTMATWIDSFAKSSDRNVLS